MTHWRRPGAGCASFSQRYRENSRGEWNATLVSHSELVTTLVETVSVDWRLDEGELVLTWIEGGGAPAHPPLKTGFGVKLLARGLLGGGGADLRYGVEGFSATFTAPASRLTDS